ncbi:MAG: ATP-binding protein [Xenococcus sp. MO_188.B8]|nr:ATP-binding protein [Xenococcus sp. MO_188.B8]
MNSGSLRDLRKRVTGTLKNYQVKLLLVDDAHVLKRQAMTELVKIFDDLRIPVVMAGVKELDQKLTQCQGYGHINNSFLGGYNFRTLSEREITSVTQSWEEQVLSNWDTKLNLAEDSEIVDKLYSATGGLIQPLFGCLRKIAIAQLNSSFSENPNGGIDIDRVIGQYRQARFYKEDCQ